MIMYTPQFDPEHFKVKITTSSGNVIGNPFLKSVEDQKGLF